MSSRSSRSSLEEAGRLEQALRGMDKGHGADLQKADPKVQKFRVPAKARFPRPPLPTADEAPKNWAMKGGQADLQMAGLS